LFTEPPQATGKQVHKRRSNNWPKGVSGNPLGGAIRKIRSEAQQARCEEKLRAGRKEREPKKRLPTLRELGLE